MLKENSKIKVPSPKKPKPLRRESKNSSPKKKEEKKSEDINLLLQQLLSHSHDFVNETLFEPVEGQQLSKPVLTWTHDKRAAGTFWSVKREDQESEGCWNIGGQNAFEITMNPHYVLNDKTGKYFLRVMTHECTHQWQGQYGKPGKTYHNSQFADKMESFGLICSHTGHEGGRRTGRTMREYVVPGKFEEMFENRTPEFKRLFEKVSHLAGFSSPKKAKKNKIKYKCYGEDCDLTVWGKPGLSEGGKLFCFDCDQPLDEA